DKVGTGGVTIDTALSDTSTNPVQNKVIKAAIDDKADKTVATTEANGLMSASDKKRFNNIGNVYALKSLYGDTTIDVGRKTGTDVGICSDAEGWHTTASGNYSHTEGLSTTASNRCSHAEGVSTVASGESSHAEGVGAVAFGDYSHARGYNTITNNTCETASGKYNVSNDNTLFSIGDGTADDARHNAFEITTTGGKLHDKDIATTDLIPTSLPANGGNADTVGGIGIADLRQITQTVINTLPAVPNGEGDFFVICDLSDTSFPYWYGHLSVRYGSYTGEYVATFRTTGNDNKVYYNTYLTNHWHGWQEISATPIRSTQISGSTNATGNVQLWTADDKRIPIAAVITDRYAYIFRSSNGFYYIGICHPDYHTMSGSEAVSGTVYYIEQE
ncbi:MAG: hypothetical protein MR546_08925, partial [Oscillospiraceae bacterium]|nr:hypothetical protein [Oscillospiraceae bacterium]